MQSATLVLGPIIEQSVIFSIGRNNRHHWY